jgi:hypothetical protein
MPDFTFTSPEGQQYTVHGPDGATKEQAFTKLQEGLKSGAIKADASKTPEKQTKADPGYVSGVKDATTQLGNATAGDGTVTGAVKATAKTALGVGETALGMAGSVVGDIADASGSEYSALTGSKKPAELGAKIKNYVSQITAPRTDAGKAIAGEVGAVSKPLGDLLEALPKYLEENGHDVAAKDLRAVLDVAGGEEAILGKGSAAIKDVSAADKAAIAKTVEKESSTPKREAAVAAQQAGYTLPPSQARPGVINNRLEGMTGKQQMEAHTSAKNQEVTQRLVGNSLGIPEDQTVTRDAVESVIKKAGQDYQALKDIKNPNVEVGTEYQDALDKIKTNVAGISDSGKKPVIKRIDELKSQTRFNVNDAIVEISNLRDDAGIAYKAGDNGAGKAYRAAATAIEDAIEKHLKDTQEPAEMIENYRNSRVTIAKGHTVLDAMDADGNINARDLVKAFKRSGIKPTGDMKTVVDFAKHFPKSAKTPAALGSVVDNTKLDHAVGAGIGSAIGGALAGPHGAVLGATVGATVSPLGQIRKGLTSQRYQRTGAKAVTASEEVNKRVKSKETLQERKRRLLQAAAYAEATGAAGDADERSLRAGDYSN